MRMPLNTNISRNDIIRYLYYGITALLLIFLQMTVVDFISIANITPDLLIILVVIIAIREGQFKAVFAGFFIGLLFDLISIDVIGTNALTKTITAFFAGYFYREGEERLILGSYKFILIVLAASLLHNFIYNIFYLKLSEASLSMFFLKYGVAASLYTSVLAVFPMLFRISRKY